MPTISTPESTLSLMQQLQQKLGKADGKLKGVPDENNLRQIVDKLSGIISQIQAEKKAVQEAEKVWGLSGKAWNRVRVAIGGTAVLAAVSGYIAQISDYYDQQSDEPPPSTVYSGTIAVCLTAIAGGAHIIYNHTQKKRKAIFAAQDRQLEEALSLQKFFLALNLYLQTEKRSSKILKRCAQELTEVPEEIIPSKAKARWMRAAAKTLPLESTLRQKLERAETIAAKISQDQKTASSSTTPIADSWEEAQETSEYEEILAPKRRRKKKKRSQFLRSTDADQGANSTPRPSIMRDTEATVDPSLSKLARELSQKLGVQLFYADGCTFDNKGKVYLKA